MRTSRWPAPPVLGGYGLPLGFVAGIVVTLVAVAAGVTAHPDWSVAVLTVTVAGVAAVTTPAAALGTVVICWCLHDGFVLGRHGNLVFTPASGLAAVILTGVALGALAMAAFARLVRETAEVPPATIVPRPRPALENLEHLHD
ncbi:hypothetical protein [Amycolatopsis sp. GM8]|uniref:hypothetical protein n=1 Tax=Amycolatopsis sp. GM8 TaxID=2896530 RepID=UPI001F39D4C0|nr:hypothetical protein [Amycolatopsis sp. GM8]